MSVILGVSQLTKSYMSGGKPLTVLTDISFAVERKETCAIVGPSGSGKTTLLGLCAGLDLPSTGKVELTGVDLNALNEDERALLRNKKVGFIFQNFQLIPSLTALENVLVPGELQGQRHIKEKAKDLLHSVGLSDRFHHYPNQLSGGEQQRVAMARAFANDPEILFADEPTGNLDAETGDKVLELFFTLNQTAGTTLIVVTHDPILAKKTNRIISLAGGKLHRNPDA